jgi:D-alanine transaminase
MNHWNGRQPAGRIAYVNGRYLAHGGSGVHIEDRGLQLGDSIYEVIGVVGGALCDEEEHLDRLERSLKEIRMAMPMQRSALKLAIRELQRRNKLRDGFVYMQVTRGALRRDHPIPERGPRPTLIMTARARNPAAVRKLLDEGIAVRTMADERWGRCDIKTTQLLANALAKTEARRAGAYEAWLTDSDGFVTEGASTTAWIVDAEGRLVTRELSTAILPGVTRRVILEVAAEAQVSVVQRAFTSAEASRAREAFISSASGSAVPVLAIDGSKIGDGKPGQITRRIQELYAARVAAKTH